MEDHHCNVGTGDNDIDQAGEHVRCLSQPEHGERNNMLSWSTFFIMCCTRLHICVVRFRVLNNQLDFLRVNSAHVIKQGPCKHYHCFQLATYVQKIYDRPDKVTKHQWKGEVPW